MQPGRLAAWSSTILLVVGALLVGDAVHVSLVAGRRALTSPPVVLRLVPGGVLLLVGYRLQGRIADAVGTGEPADGTDRDGDAAFDTELSPLDEGDLEGRERAEE